jgi:hypothetical protein
MLRGVRGCPSVPFLSIPQEWGARGLKASFETSSMGHPLQPGSGRCYNQVGEAVWVGIMRALRAIKEAALAFHRWFMKYSGTTMTIDSIEERRSLRHN